MKDIGLQITDRLAVVGMSRDTLAKKIGITKRNVDLLIRLNTSRVFTLKKIAKVLNFEIIID